MCGIVGYLGKKNASEVILDGLLKLEYRGYDSSGIAVNNNNHLDIRKHKGRISILQKDIGDNKMEGHLGIGHTRWATHGEPSDVNSHPHFNEEKSIAIVHNGIIENYVELREELINEGVEFLTQTDSEVIANLIDKYYDNNLLDAVYKAIGKLKGAFALGIISKYNDNELVAVRKDSPLVVGSGKEDKIIASDLTALLDYTRNVYFVDNGEVVHIVGDEIKIYDFDRNLVYKDPVYIDLDIESASKGGYDHFMEKEIYEQPFAIKETLERRLDDDSTIVLDGVNIGKKELEKIKKIYIVACGTAYHAGLLGKYAIEKFMNVQVIADIASEFRYSDTILDDESLVILVSQSGETADTLAVLRDAKKKGAKVLAITNVVASSIAREADAVFYTWAGPEISVASTKAYTTQIVSLYMIALDFAIKKGTIDREFYNKIIEDIRKVPVKIKKVFENKDKIKELAQKFVDKTSAFYLGRGLDSGLAMEGALKLKEISYVHAEALAAGELKHGTIALIEKEVPIVVVATQDNLFEKMVSNMQEVKARGGYIIAISQEHNKEVKNSADEVIYIPDIDDIVAPIVAIVPMQMLAYYVSVLRGCDVDKPRNLAKSVTVE